MAGQGLNPPGAGAGATSGGPATGMPFADIRRRLETCMPLQQHEPGQSGDVTLNRCALPPEQQGKAAAWLCTMS